MKSVYTFKFETTDALESLNMQTAFCCSNYNSTETSNLGNINHIVA